MKKLKKNKVFELKEKGAVKGPDETGGDIKASFPNFIGTFVETVDDKLVTRPDVVITGVHLQGKTPCVYAFHSEDERARIHAATKVAEFIEDIYPGLGSMLIQQINEHEQKAREENEKLS